MIKNSKFYVDCIKEYRDIVFRIKTIELDIEELELETGIKAIGYEERTGSTNKISSTVEDSLMGYEEEKERLIYQKKKLEIKKRKVDLFLESGQLTRNETLYIEFRYIKAIKRMTRNEIACSLRLNSIKGIENSLYKKLGYYL